MLKSKLHRLTVTEANVDYQGSITLDSNLLEAAQILPYEEVHVWNVTRGTRLQTYAMAGEPDSGRVCINGAAARLVHPGDVIIVATFAQYDESEVGNYRPRIVLVSQYNQVQQIERQEAPGLLRPPR
jgi:aspartate 1-decarboxylase